MIGTAAGLVNESLQELCQLDQMATEPDKVALCTTTI